MSREPITGDTVTINMSETVTYRWLGDELIELIPGRGYRLTKAGRAWRRNWAPDVLAGPS